MKVLLTFMLLLSGSPDFDSAVLFLTGASSMEDLDETTLERFRALQLRPLDLNRCSRSRLVSSGLMSAFQAASLLDWRQRSGDVLSYTELGLVDGFTPDYAEALKPFTTLESSGPPGKRRQVRMHHDLMLRASARSSGEETEHCYGMKYKAALGETAELNWSTRNSYSDKKLGIGTVSAAVYGRKYLGKMILGHFNARFGQGLNLWSGFSMQPWSSVQAMRKNSTGLSPTGSFSPSHLGAAADFEFGRWSVAMAYSIKEKMPVGAISYTGKRFTAGLTARTGAVGADFKLGFPNVGVYGEFCWQGRPDGVLGLRWLPSYGTELIGFARFADGLPEAAAGVSAQSFSSVVYWSSKQARAFVKYNPQLNAGPVTIVPSLRLAACRKDGWRLEARGELQAEAWEWMLRSRLDLVKCNGISWLFCSEAGLTGGRLRTWLRWTLFKVENWDDRIYVYERDAPGTFNVPAYYGKGWALSLAGSWKIAVRHAMYYRISYVEYPWNSDYKAPKLEVKVQYQLSL